AMVMRYALAYPQVRFRLEHDGRLTLQTSGRGDRRDVLAALYGPEVARALIPVLAEDPDLGLTIEGYISPPGTTRSHRRDMLFFVNGRPVHDPALVAAVLQGYQNLLMKGRYPISALFLTLPPEAVDVNVHPTKAEVRFREPDPVFRAVVRAVRKALLAHAPLATDGATLTQWDVVQPRWAGASSAPAESGTRESGAPVPPPGATPPLPDLHDATLDSPHTAAAPAPEARAPAGSSPAPENAEQGATPILRLVGQVAGTYLVAEGPDGLYLIDQHAAHERVLFERLRKQWLAKQPASQPLLEPVTVVLPPDQARALEDQLDALKALGFTIEPFGLNMFRVRAVPALFAHQDPARVVQAAVEDIDEDETPLRHAREEQLIARICKGLAVKAGQQLSREEQERLLQDLLACENPRTCPHGRPTMIHIPVSALERQFGRLGPR
ncbi:MAG: DNA mismatch repair protein MutL, partial [Chloroflexi bacterium]|nr:DNA mismatch repair protein MutL [Chloroflexota bacterium]